jgi:Methyltransferase domain
MIPQAQLHPQPIIPAPEDRFANPGEREVLCALANGIQAQTVIEIGVSEGITARCLLDNVPTIQKYIGIDVPHTHKTTLPIQRGEVPKIPGRYVLRSPKFRLILNRKGSQGLVSTDLPRCDFILIDGSHDKESVWHDTILATVLTQQGGIIVWHDYHDKDTVDVRAVLEECHKNGARIYHVENTWIAFEVRP